MPSHVPHQLTPMPSSSSSPGRSLGRAEPVAMTIAREVAAYKIEHGLPVLDRSREEAVLQSRAGMLADPYWAPSVRELYECIMALSRAEQEKLLQAEKERS